MLKVISRIGLAGVRCKGASILRIEVVRKNILEIVVAGWICTELGVVLRWSDIDWCSCARFRCLAYRSGLREERGPLTALPSPHKTRSKQLTALIGRYANIEGVLLQEGIEFRNKLEEIAERKKATVQSPGWPGYRGLGSDIDIAFAADEDHSLTYYLLTRVWLRIKAGNRGLGDTIEEAETTARCQRSRVSATRAVIQTVHDPSAFQAVVRFKREDFPNFF